MDSHAQRALKLSNGDKEIRTPDPLLARQVLSQLSYTPIAAFSPAAGILGLSGLEPPTSRLSGVRSNRLSYKPIEFGGHLLSHTVTSIVPSAAYVLTIVFGMGTGVSHKRIDTTNLGLFGKSSYQTAGIYFIFKVIY